VIEVTKLSRAQAEPDSVHPDFDSGSEAELEFELILDDWVQLNHQHADSV